MSLISYVIHSNRNYRVKITRGQHSGYNIAFEQECFFLCIFRFWSNARNTHSTTITYALELISKMQSVYGPLEIFDATNSTVS